MKKSLIALTASAAFVALGVGTVLADNHNDTYWKNEYRVWSPNDHTPVRTKTNTTSYYNKTYTLSGGKYIWIWAALFDGRDASGGHKYQSFADGRSQFLWNNAVENHGPNINVIIDSQAWINGNAQGAWSPDSVGG